MKKLGLFVSLSCYLLTGYVNAAASGNSNAASQPPQTYFLSDPTPAPQPAAASEPSSRINATAQPYSNANLQNQAGSQNYTMPTYPIPVPSSPLNNTLQYTAPTYPTSSYGTEVNTAGYGQKNQQMQTIPANQAQNGMSQNALGCGQSFQGYRYTGQGLLESDPCCDEEPADQACGDSYSLFCHYRPCHYYTTECVYVPRYEYLRCCRYVPEYYTETRCRKVPQYYKVMKQRTVQEPYCIMRCCVVEQYNSETCCNETVPMYYPETCYRDVPQYYEETCSRDVPQYYEETCCRQVPQYYYTCQCKYCPEYKYKKHCKYIPQYYYKHETNRNPIGMEGPNCCETP